MVSRVKLRQHVGVSEAENPGKEGEVEKSVPRRESLVLPRIASKSTPADGLI